MKYYRTLIQVEILSDDIYDFKNLEEVAYDIDQGDCSGKSQVLKQESIDEQEMVWFCDQHGTNPTFFGIKS